MPSTVILPAPLITWPYRVSYPGPFTNRVTRENFRNPNDFNRIATVNGGKADSATGPNDVQAIGKAESGSTGGDFFDCRAGVMCSRTDTAPRSYGWTFPWWAPRFDATLLPPGLRIPEGGVVAVIDAFLNYEWVGGADADMVGVWIGGGLDASAAQNYRVNTPGGAFAGLDTGGAGMMLRADGTGFDYLAWGLGGAVAERVPVVMAPNRWNVFRFILISGLPGGFASLSIGVNGAIPPVIQRTYGTAVLPVPFLATPAAVGDPAVPALVFTGNSVGPPNGWSYAFEAKFGRFIPSGVEIQGA